MIALADAMGEPQVGAAAAKAFRGRLADVRTRTAGPKVRALIVVDDEARGVAGRENYLNDVLEIAGGENAIPAGRSPYPSIDREMLIDLNPEVIFQLLPDASPQVRARAERNWQQLSQLSAVREGRVHIFTDPWCLRPSQHAADLAERFARALNEARAGGPAPATQPAGSHSTAPSAHVAESRP
jgi:iron complex transport system substrate-binding protein